MLIVRSLLRREVRSLSASANADGFERESASGEDGHVHRARRGRVLVLRRRLCGASSGVCAEAERGRNEQLRPAPQDGGSVHAGARTARPVQCAGGVALGSQRRAITSTVAGAHVLQRDPAVGARQLLLLLARHRVERHSFRLRHGSDRVRGHRFAVDAPRGATLCAGLDISVCSSWAMSWPSSPPWARCISCFSPKCWPTSVWRVSLFGPVEGLPKAVLATNHLERLLEDQRPECANLVLDV